MKEQSWHKIEVGFEFSMPKNLYDNILVDDIDGFEFFFIF